ncbi:hypothetical protein [Mycobacterium hubeiense]|uniref:hypothetical protein n=1 Tax=Mycobacterium hubeiense TaxID=1867256 RepID=UPI000C7EA883|nr:hypothetical protein [Mycobacterium sp. QGD 101]
MNVSVRSYLMAGLATVSAGAVALAPIHPTLPDITVPAQQTASTPAMSQAMVDLLAAAQRMTQTVAGPVSNSALTAAAAGQLAAPQDPLLQVLLDDPVRLLGPAAPLGSVTPSPQLSAIPIAPNIANTIDQVYIWAEPWVRWGFEVATDVVSWIPAVGWFAGQIMVFYTFGEGIVASAVFNFTDWLRGQGGIIENVVDFGLDVGAAFIWLGIDEWNYFLPPLPPLPFPLPPRPPAQDPFLAAETLQPPDVGVTNAASDLVNAIYIPVRDGISYGVDVLQAVLDPIPFVEIVGDQVNLLYDVLAEPIADSVVFGLIDPVLNDPLNINSYIDGAFNVGNATINALINTGIAEVDYVLGGGWIPFAATAANEVATTPEDAGSVDAGLDVLLAGGADDAGQTPLVNNAVKPVEELGKTAEAARSEALATVSAAAERRAEQAQRLAKAPEAVAKGLVQAQGEVRESIETATEDVTGAARTGRPGKVTQEVAKAPGTVAKGLRDGATEAAKGLQQARNQARNAVSGNADKGSQSTDNGAKNGNNDKGSDNDE